MGSDAHQDGVSLPLIGRLRPAAVSPPTRYSIIRGVMVFRWLSALWAVGVFEYEIYDRNVRTGLKSTVAHPLLGSLLFFGLFCFLGVQFFAYHRNSDSMLTPRWIFGEIAMATVFFLADVWAYGDPNHSQALPTVWPIAVIATVALAGGQGAAVLTGFGFGVARYVGWLPYNETLWSLTRVSSLILMMIAGWSAGYLFRRLEIADLQISSYRAREDVARTLHDGVLQTLALIQRRSDDDDLVSLARRQEHDLREYLFTGSEALDQLAPELRRVGHAAEEMFGFAVSVVCAPDLPPTPPESTAALVGAVTEALNNVGKHAGATAVTVYAEPDDTAAADGAVFVSVKDDGTGFDTGSASTGQGIAGSIRARLERAGGRSDIRSVLGRGTEVHLWL